MPATLPQDIKLDALRLLSEGLSVKDVADTFGVSEKTIRRWDKRYQTFGDIEAGYKPRGVKSKVACEMTMVLCAGL